MAALGSSTRASAQGADDRAATSPPSPPPPAAAVASQPAPADAAVEPKLAEPLWRVSGYVQSEYQSHEDSQDQLRPGGALWNQDRFLVRRGRLKVERDGEWTALMLELDGNTVGGPALRMHHGEASLVYRGGRAFTAAPYVKLTFGQFDTPFGYELPESSKTRFFLERSTAGRSFFPAEPDVGVRLSGEVGWFRYAAAVVNGEPLGEKVGFPLQDPNGAKDIVGRVGAFATPWDGLEISGGVSVLDGKGFHPGTDATKNQVVWRDSNENGVVENGELQTLPGVAAKPSTNFDRWLVGADLELRWRSPVGWTQLYGEVQVGTNMDRGLFIADPVLTSIDARELGYYVGFVQEITPYGVVGFRYDDYDPNADLLGLRGGHLQPATMRIKTYSPLVGAVLPGRARLLFQYDFVEDRLALDPRGVPTDLNNDRWTLRLQVEL